MVVQALHKNYLLLWMPWIQILFLPLSAQAQDVETVMVRTGLSLGAARAAAERLVDQGRLMSGVGWWSRE